MANGENFSSERRYETQGSDVSADSIAKNTHNLLGNLADDVNKKPDTDAQEKAREFKRANQFQDTTEQQNNANDAETLKDLFGALEERYMKAGDYLIMHDKNLSESIHEKKRGLKDAYDAMINTDTPSENAKFNEYKKSIQKVQMLKKEVEVIVTALKAEEAAMGGDSFKSHINSANGWNKFEGFFANNFSSQQDKDKRSSDQGELALTGNDTDVSAYRELLKSDPSKVMRELEHNVKLLEAEAEYIKTTLNADSVQKETFVKDTKELVKKKAAEMQEQNTTIERLKGTDISFNDRFNNDKGFQVIIPLEKSINISNKQKIWSDILTLLEKEAGESPSPFFDERIAQMKAMPLDKIELNMDADNTVLSVDIQDLNKKTESSEDTEYVATEFKPEKTIETQAVISPERLPQGLPQPMSNDFKGLIYTGHTPTEVAADPAILREYEFRHADLGVVDASQNKGWLVNKEGKIIGMYVDSAKKQVAWINTPPNSQKFTIDFPFTATEQNKKLEEYNNMPKKISQAELAKFVMGNEKEADKYQFYMSYQLLPDSSGENAAIRMEVKAYQKQSLAKKTEVQPEIKPEVKKEVPKAVQKKIEKPVKTEVQKTTPVQKTPEQPKPVINQVKEKPEVQTTDKLATTIYNNLERLYKVQMASGDAASATYHDGILYCSLDASDTTPEGELTVEYDKEKREAEMLGFIKKNPSKLLNFKDGDQLELRVKDKFIMIGSQVQFEKVNNAAIKDFYDALQVISGEVAPIIEKEYIPEHLNLNSINKATGTTKEIYVDLNGFTEKGFAYPHLNQKKVFFSALPVEYKKYLGLTGGNSSGADLDFSFRKNKNNIYGRLVISKKSPENRSTAERILNATTQIDKTIENIKKIWGTGEGDREVYVLSLKRHLIRLKSDVDGLKNIASGDTRIPEYDKFLNEKLTFMKSAIETLLLTADEEKKKEYGKLYKELFNEDVKTTQPVEFRGAK